MKLFRIIGAVVLLCAWAPAYAQSTNAVVVSACGTPPAAYTAGANRQITQDTTGTLCTVGGGGGGGGAVTVADGADVTQGAKADTAYTGTGSASITSIDKGIYNLLAAPLPAGTNAIGSITNTSFGAIQSGAWSVGLNAATHVQSTAYETSHVICSTACKLNSFEVTPDATLSAAVWYLLILDASADPGNGAVTPAKCFQISPGSGSPGASYPTGGIQFSTGVVLVASTTGCLTETQSAHAFLAGDKQ